MTEPPGLAKSTNKFATANAAEETPSKRKKAKVDSTKATPSKPAMTPIKKSPGRSTVTKKQDGKAALHRSSATNARCRLR